MLINLNIDNRCRFLVTQNACNLLQKVVMMTADAIDGTVADTVDDAVTVVTFIFAATVVLFVFF